MYYCRLDYKQKTVNKSLGPVPPAGPLLQRGCMCQLQMYYLITNFHSLTSQNIGEKLQNMLCMLLIRLDRETANSGCIIIFQCYIGYKTEDRRHNINYNCIEEGEVDGTIAAQRTTKIEGLHFGQYLPLRWTETTVRRVGSPCTSQSRHSICSTGNK